MEVGLRDWVDMRQALTGYGTYCLTPRTSRGLTMNDLDEIRNKIEEWANAIASN